MFQTNMIIRALSIEGVLYFQEPHETGVGSSVQTDMLIRALSIRGFSLLPRAVLVAIAIPIFTSQLEKSREATDLANVRAAYAEQMTAVLESDGVTAIADITVPAKQTKDKWQSVSGEPATATIAEGTSTSKVNVPCHTTGESYTVKVDVSSQTVTVQ